MKEYQKPHQNIEDVITTTLNSIQISHTKDWIGITSNELWKKLNKEYRKKVKTKKWICSKLTYLNTIDKLIKDGSIIIEKRKRWKKKKLLKLDKDYINFYSEMNNLEKWHKGILNNFENACKKYKKDKEKVCQESITFLNFVAGRFGWEIILKRMVMKTEMRRKFYEKFFVYYSNILLTFLQDFLNISKKYGIDKDLKEYVKRVKVVKEEYL